MINENFERGITLYFRICIAWTFLYAGASEIYTHFNAAGFLAATKTFHAFFMLFASPELLPYTNFLVQWGHFLIGLSLLVGLLVRVSSVFAVLLLIMYYFGHMDFPYVESSVNFIMDYHLVYCGVLVYLIAVRAGRVCGLDGWLERQPLVERHTCLQALV